MGSGGCRAPPCNAADRLVVSTLAEESYMRMSSRNSKRLVMGGLIAMALAVAGNWSGAVRAQAPTPAKGVKYAQVSPTDLQEWLTYLASDQLTGRQIYTEGYGLAAGYIQENLRKWGVKPIGENGTYLQTVKNRGYNVTRNSTVTVEVGGQTRTFKHGEHVRFPVNSGGKQTVTFTGVQFVGSTPPDAGTDLKGKLAVWMNSAPPAAAGGRGGRGGGRGGAAAGAVAAGATGVVGFVEAPPAPTATDEALAKAQEVA